MKSWPAERACSAFYSAAFLIKCVFLSHNVIWKQSLPTAGSAFTIGKHGKGKAGTVRGVTREPPPRPLGSRSEAYRGLCTGLIRARSAFKQAARGHPSSGGSACSWGRHFRNASQIRWIRCRPGRRLPSSRGRMWRPASQRGSRFPPPGAGRALRPRSLWRAEPAPCRCHRGRP